MDVIEKAKKGRNRWQLFKEIKPGHRFQTRFSNHRRRRERGETWKYGRMFNMAGGIALVAAGLAFVPTPGPSYMIIVIGMWMLAGEFLLLARFFDRVEMRLRGLGRWVRATWRDSSMVARTMLVAAILLFVAALGYALIT